MKKFIMWVLVLSATFSMAAQNNPYSIDDECFKYFREAENSVDDLDNAGFDVALQSLWETAVRKKDAKAQALYYVVKLKRTVRYARLAPLDERLEWNARVDAELKTAQDFAKGSGYNQYYYYAQELAQNYYFNTQQDMAATNLVNMMMRECREAGDEYGFWQGTRYLAVLYKRMSDEINSARYFREYVHIRETTQDSLILRQGIAASCLDLGDTYPAGSDSARFYYKKAEKYARSLQDSVKIVFTKSMLAALDGDMQEYDDYKAFCKSQPVFKFAIHEGDVFFNCADNIMAGHPYSVYKVSADSLTMRNQMKYLEALASKRGQWEAAAKISSIHFRRIQSDLALLNSHRLEEISVQYGNNKLQADLADASRKMARNTMLILILVAVLLLAALLFVWLHMRALQKANKRDEARIAELQDANEKVRLADAAKTRFVQNMSHEVRTPLNAIVGFSQLLSLPDGSFPEQEKEEFAGHIVNNTKMLTMLLDDILNASAMDSGKYRITLEEGEVHFMANESITSSEHRLQPGVRMYYQPDSDEPFSFVTDPRRVQQILINLLTNACKNTPSGEIRLSSSMTENPGYVTYAVTDTGPGVPPEKAEAIFERFTKLNEFVQGTGLGLSICRDIAGRMGAKVYLDTAYAGNGARFVFLVPLTPPEIKNS